MNDGIDDQSYSNILHFRWKMLGMDLEMSIQFWFDDKNINTMGEEKKKAKSKGISPAFIDNHRFPTHTITPEVGAQKQRY